MKMKIVIMSVLLSGIYFNQSLSQTLTEEERQQVLHTLQFTGFLSSDSAARAIKVGEALYEVKNFNIVEAIPIIKSRIWQCNASLQRLLIQTLYELKDARYYPDNESNN